MVWGKEAITTMYSDAGKGQANSTLVTESEGSLRDSATDALRPVLVRRGWIRWLCLHLPLVLIVLFGAYLLTINVATPWATEHEDDGLFSESMAINHIRFGLGVTKGQGYPDEEARSENIAIVDRYMAPQGQTSADQWAFFLSGPVHPYVYGHHPPLHSLTVAGSLLVFGYHYWAVRLVPIVYSLAGLVLFYSIACAVFDIGVARLAAFLYSTFPIMAYFGRNVAQEAPTLFWALLLLLSYVRWRHDQRNRWLALAAVSVCIGGLYDWPLYYFACILFTVDCIAHRRFNRRLAMATVGTAAVTFIVVMAQLLWALNGNVAYLVAAFTYRTGTGTGPGTHIPLGDWLRSVLFSNIVMFGLWCAIATPLALLFLAARLRDEGFSLRVCIVAICGLWGLSHILIFPGGAYVHDYWQFYLLPFTALAVGWMFVAVGRRRLPRTVVRVAVLCGLAGLVFLPDFLVIYTLYHGAGTFAPILPL